MASVEEDSDENVRQRVRQTMARHFYSSLTNENFDPELMEKIQNDPDFNKYYKVPERKPEKPWSLSNILWLLAAIAMFYWTDFPTTVLYHPRINRFWLNLGLICICVNLSIACFLIVWLSWIKKLNSDDWDRMYPAAIPTATACFIFGAIFMNVGLWPLYRFFTPLILFVMFMGVVVLIAMIPPFSSSCTSRVNYVKRDDPVAVEKKAT